MSSGVPVTIVNDLLPLESYPLMAEVTSTCFRGGTKSVQTTFRGENTKVSLDIYFPIFEDLRDFFPDSGWFLFAQITRLTLIVRAGPLDSIITQFRNLERLELERFIQQDQVFKALWPSRSPGLVPSVPCPHLKVIQIEPDSRYFTSLEGFVTMAKLREEVGYVLTLAYVLPSLGPTVEPGVGTVKDYFLRSQKLWRSLDHPVS